MRFKASQALVISPQDGSLVAYNYLTKSVFECSADLLAFLSKLADWTDSRKIAEDLPDFGAEELQQTLSHLVEVHAILEEGSPLSQREVELQEKWSWGLPTALMHFSVQDNAFMTLEEAETIQREKAEAEGTIELFSKNSDSISLPDPISGKPLIQLMARRRTVRATKRQPVSLQQLSECLFSGLGITGETENCVGKLPLSMTPSGGARNPYEAYVFARDVTGLAPGIYHYSAIEHNLGSVGPMDDVNLAELVGGQEWAEDKPCMIVLCAHLDRTMWKYIDPNAYRVVMIEAGHIGQNIMLAATDHGMTGCPTAAINHSLVKQLLNLPAITQAPIYAITLSFPGEA